MNKEETAKILSVLKAAYPNSYRDVTDQDAKTMITLWSRMFEDIPYEVVGSATQALIATSKWPPSIAELKEKIHSLTCPEMLDEQEAWQLVTKALSNGIYDSQKEFDNLPDIVKKAVGSHNMIKEWAMLDISEVQTVIQSHFLRTYRAKAEKEKEYQLLPQEVRTMLSKTSESIKSLA